MKFRTYLIQFLFLTGLTFVFLSSSSGRVGVSGRGNTGAPGESGGQCNGCHGGTAFGVTTTTLSINEIGGSPITDYTPGVTYDVTLTVNHTMNTPAAFGFQMTALDGSNTDVADFSNFGSRTKLSLASNVGNRRYVEHNSRNPSNTFTMRWTAPMAGTGDVTFYRIGNSVNGSGTSGDSGGAGETTILPESTILPITLTFFEASTKDNKTSFLTWETEAETNHDYFEVQHSVDGRTFTTLEKVAGQRYSTTLQKYNFSHATPSKGTNYYRLKSIDLANNFTYSEVTNVEILKDKEIQVQILGNPVQNSLQLNVQSQSEEQVVWRIFNQQGQLVFEKNLTLTKGTQLLEANVFDLPNGVYFSSLENAIKKLDLSNFLILN